MKIYFRALMLMCIMLFVMSALAADDATDNACYDGGSMAGKCDWPTEAETEWAWTCGWYIARAERAVIAQDAVPAWCAYNNQTTVSYDDCYDSNNPSYADFNIVGPMTTADNAQSYLSANGSCQNPALPVTIVEASGQSDADGKCQAIWGPSYSGGLLSPMGYYSTPANWYVCLHS